MSAEDMTDYLSPAPDFTDPAVTEAYDELTLWSSHFGTLLLENLPMRRNMSVLDLGCGTGFPLLELANSLGRTCRLVGLDPWEAALRRADRKRQAYGLANVWLVKGDGSRMPFRSGEFDLVVSNLGLNNFDDPPTIATECRRVLKSDGTLVMTTNVKGHMSEFYDIFRKLLVERGDSNYLNRLAANEDHRGTRQSVCDLLGRSGFGVEKVVEGSFTMRYADGSAFLNHYFIRLGFLPGWRSAVDPEDEVQIFSMLEERLNEASQRQGEWRVTIPMLYVQASA